MEHLSKVPSDSISLCQKSEKNKFLFDYLGYIDLADFLEVNIFKTVIFFCFHAIFTKIKKVINIKFY